MQLVVNGETREFADIQTVQQLLEKLGYEPKSIAVAINGQFVPRHEYPTFQLAEKQALEVVAPMQGG